jgi:bacteriocin-like protein
MVMNTTTTHHQPGYRYISCIFKGVNPMSAQQFTQQSTQQLTQQPEELNAAQLAQISGGDDNGYPGIEPYSTPLSDTDLSKVQGGEDGGYRRMNPANVGPKEGLFSVLSDTDLAAIVGGEDGGYRRQNPAGVGPTEGLIH